MNQSELFQDLKQFIQAELHQSLAGMATKDDLKSLATKDDLASLRVEMDQRFDEVLNAVGEHLHQHDVRLDDHDDQFARLRSKAA